MFFRIVLLAVVVFTVTPAQSPPPALPYELVPDWPKLPFGVNLLETPGVAVGPRQQVYIFHRGAQPIIEVGREAASFARWVRGCSRPRTV